MKSRLCSFVVAIVASACSSMPVNETVVRNEYASVSFKYADAGETTEDNANDSVYCLLNRIQYTCHYFVKTDKNGAIEHKNEAVTAEEVTDGSLFESKLYIKPGEYNIIAFDKPGKGIVVDSLVNFVAGTEVSLKDLLLRVENRDMSQLEALVNDDETMSKWIDLNGAYPYIENIDAMAYDIKKNFMINSGSETILEFTPQNITQKLVIPFQVTVEDGVTISKALMEVSGLARRRYLLNDVLVADYDGDDTGRTIVEAKLVNSEGNNLFYEVELYSFGVIPNRLDASSIGPGVAQLAIFAEASGKSKILRTTKNISPFLRAANSVVYDDMEDQYRIGNYDVRLDTNFRFMITKEQVMSDTEDGVHEWDDEGNDMEGEI